MVRAALSIAALAVGAVDALDNGAENRQTVIAGDPAASAAATASRSRASSRCWSAQLQPMLR
jgi:hypothetical protein